MMTSQEDNVTLLGFNCREDFCTGLRDGEMGKICRAPAHRWGTRAGDPDGGSGRQQAVARRGSECGKRVKEGGRDCFPSFITVAARLSVSRWPHSLAQMRAVSHPQNKPTTSVAKSNQNVKRTAPQPPTLIVRRPLGGHVSASSIQHHKQE